MAWKRSLVHLLFLSSVVSVLAQDPFQDWPPCAQSCARTVTTERSPSDVECICESSNWRGLVFYCVAHGCSTEDLSTAVTLYNAMCAPFTSTTTGFASSPTVSS